MKAFMICLCLIKMSPTLERQLYVVPQQERWEHITQGESDEHKWRAATFKGLTVGRATRRDMLRLFGKPTWSELMGEDKHISERWYHYKSTDLPGDLVFIADVHSGIIVRIDLYPMNLSRDDITKYFGKGFIVTNYDFDQCLGNEESAPLYESPDGPIISVEYRSRGIAIAINYRNQVDQISYVGGPIGSPASRCKR